MLRVGDTKGLFSGPAFVFIVAPPPAARRVRVGRGEPARPAVEFVRAWWYVQRCVLWRII